MLHEAQLSLSPAYITDTLFDRFTVIAFTAQLNGQTFDNKGNNFSNKLLAAIRKAQKEDALFISAIEGRNEALGLVTAFHKQYSFTIE